MQITRKSPVTGQENSREIDVTQEQIDRWQRGELIQNVMPFTSADDREFLMTGMTQEDWDDVIGAEDPEEFTGEGEA